MAEYIEREAYMAELAKGTIITDDLYGMGIVSGLDYAMKKLKEQPAADVAPVVHGRWEHLEDGWFDLWRCTSCGDEWTFEYDPTNGDTRVNYCPNCGARMIEEDK